MKRFFSTFFALLALVLPFAAQNPIRDLKPTVILISIDGFRYDYLEKYKPKNLDALARRGVRAKWMTPVFPTLTFPNHYSIATGLYPEKHGIVANRMYDPIFKTIFDLGIKEEVQNGRWWEGEPIWVTAEKQGQRAAAFFFPGTEAEIKGVRPTFWKEFDDKFPNDERVKTVLSWLDLPQHQRPTFITLYFSDVDHAGHDYTPDAPEVGQAISEVDAVIGNLIEGLKQRKIFEQANLIILSDHGMARIDPRQIIVIDDYFDKNQTEGLAISGRLAHIFPKAGMEESVYENLKRVENAKCYLKTEIPQRFNYRNHRRIAPVVCINNEGWTFKTRGYKEVENKPRGEHGYDNALESMRAFFIAHGSAFKKRTVVEPFLNIDVYYVMTEILNLKPAPNDGNFETAKAVLRKVRN